MPIASEKLQIRTGKDADLQDVRFNSISKNLNIKIQLDVPHVKNKVDYFLIQWIKTKKYQLGKFLSIHKYDFNF